MKKKRFKLLAGILGLSINLLLSGCGAKTSPEEEIIETEVLEANTTEILANSIANSATDVTSAVEEALASNIDEFPEERAAFERMVNNYELIYTDEFKSVDDIYIDWNQAAGYYEIRAEKDDNQYTINLTDSSLINFLIHETSCKSLMINHDKDEELISSLTSCDTITEFSLNDSNISSLSGISCLTNLEELTISNCQNITDLSPIENLTNITKIAINGTNISDISPLANLSKLTYLNLRCNEITNPEVLEPLDNITSLTMEFNRIESVDQLRGLIEKGIITETYAENLVESSEKQRLSFSSDNYQEEAKVLYITYLDSKQAYFFELRNDNQEMLCYALTDDPFDFYNLSKDIPNCTGIKLSNIPEEFRHFSIANEEKFDAMVIEQCDFDSISFVDDFKNLTYLSIENCPNLVDSFTFSPFSINDLDSLKTLIVKGTSINNFETIKNLHSLENIELQDNNITDYGFLMNLPNLKVAIIGVDNYPFDASPLEAIQDQGVNVKVIGYYLPPREKEEETLDEESEEQVDDTTKYYGLSPEN